VRRRAEQISKTKDCIECNNRPPETPGGRGSLDAMMDDKVLAVLAAYHERMRDERKSITNGVPQPETDEWDDWRERTLLAVGPESGQLINILARSLELPRILELGTSYGYSGIWLAEAARAKGGAVTTIEMHPKKSAYAREMAIKAGLAYYIDFKVGDAVEMIDELPFGLDFVLVDLWKDLYVPCLERFYPKLNPGAIIVADNMIRPGGEDARSYRNAVRAKPGITSILLPVGTGLEISRFEPS
jgi:predicted O-methyltransferase YrrM